MAQLNAHKTYSQCVPTVEICIREKHFVRSRTLFGPSSCKWIIDWLIDWWKQVSLFIRSGRLSFDKSKWANLNLLNILIVLFIGKFCLSCQYFLQYIKSNRIGFNSNAFILCNLVLMDLNRTLFLYLAVYSNPNNSQSFNNLADWHLSYNNNLHIKLSNSQVK